MSNLTHGQKEVDKHCLFTCQISQVMSSQITVSNNTLIAQFSSEQEEESIITLGGSHCITSSTPVMSRPRAATSVATSTSNLPSRKPFSVTCQQDGTRLKVQHKPAPAQLKTSCIIATIIDRIRMAPVHDTMYCNLAGLQAPCRTAALGD